MRLFDKDALRLMKVEECEGHTIDYAAGWKACIEWIKTQPTVDAEPVKHGFWTTENSFEWHCSNCGYEPLVFESTPYCPNCGAKMDLDEPPKEEEG